MRLLILIAVFFAPITFAKDIEDLTLHERSRLLVNVSEDMTTCAAFYATVAICLNNTEPNGGDGYQELAGNVFASAVEVRLYANHASATDQGRSISTDKLMESASEAGKIRLDEEIDRMYSIMNTCENITIIRKQFLQSCNGYLENPDTLAQKWLDELFPG